MAFAMETCAAASAQLATDGVVGGHLARGQMLLDRRVRGTARAVYGVDGEADDVGEMERLGRRSASALRARFA
jgi:hypothetical protein